MKYRTRTRQLRLTVIAAAIAAGWSGAPARAAGDQPVVTAPPQIVEIIGVTPLPGVGVSRDKIPSNVQSLNSGEVNGTDSANLPDALNRRLGSVFVNEIQGNPFQPDINYRGFTASPLLGTQQGLSVYLDGVRLNQPFGDVVSWDLIPRAAISTLNLMPGSNPVFGLNTLGGAISIRTKDGLHDPGTSVQVLAGRYDRQEVTVEHGGHNSNGLHWYVTANGFSEDGWRDASPTGSARCSARSAGRTAAAMCR
jgi:outer membrane cobalamin receptor